MSKLRASRIWSYRYLLGLGLIVLLASILRLYQLDTLPPSPYWEEAALGYDAYSVLQTGKDHHGNSWPLIAFESFGDWKPSLYFYLTIPSIVAFGLNVWAVRLPSALAGIGMVVLLYFLPGLLLQLDEKSKHTRDTGARQIGLLAAFILAIEPWAITFSRAAWEVNVATFLILAGVVCFLSSMMAQGKKIWFWQICAVVMLSLSMYCYHAARLISPLLLGTLLVWFVWRSWRAKTSIRSVFLHVFVTGFCFVLLISPLLVALTSPQVASRFATENVFSNIKIIERSNQLRDLSGQSALSRLQFHRFALFGREILKNYATYLNPDFLFVSGDTNLRHSVGYLSVLYPFDIFFLLVGCAYAWKKHKTTLFFLWIWILIGLLPAAISQPNPHALRALPTLPAWILLIALGAYACVVVAKRWKQHFHWISEAVLLLIIGLYVVQLLSFELYYRTIYVQRAASWWVYGYEQLFQSLDVIEKEQNQSAPMPLYISRSLGRPAMYDWFYHQTNPRQVQRENASATKDQAEFLSFDNRTYFRDVSELTQRPAIVAVDAVQAKQIMTQFSPESMQLIDTITSVDGTIVWYILILN